MGDFMYCRSATGYLFHLWAQIPPAKFATAVVSESEQESREDGQNEPIFLHNW